MDIGIGRRRHHTAVSLPEDLVLEILVHVEDPAALFRCAATCRPWNRLVADGSFLRRRWPDQDTSDCSHTPSTFIAGFFVRKRLVNGRYSTETHFVPTPRSVLGPGRRLLGSFFPEDASLLDKVLPLTARGGLLLIRLIPRGAHPATVLRLAVCNMLKGVCDVLPPLDCDWRFACNGYTILTSSDCSANGEQQAAPTGYSAFFKVLIIGNKNIDGSLGLYTFSSQEATWSTPARCPFASLQREGDYMSFRRPDAVMCNGMAHWLVICIGSESIRAYNCTLDVDTETCCATPKRIEILEKYLYSRQCYDIPHLSVTTGRTLSVFCQESRGMQLVIWTRQNDVDGEGCFKWVQNCVIEFKPPVDAKVARLANLDEKGGKLLVDDIQSNIYIADLETGAMEKVIYWSDDWHSSQTCVLLEMDWPSFFTSRLNSP